MQLREIRGIDLPRRSGTEEFPNVDEATRRALHSELSALDQNLREVLSRIRDQVEHTHVAGDITSGVFDVARIPDIPESKVTDGTILARLAAAETVAGQWVFSSPVRGPAGSAAAPGFAFSGATNTGLALISGRIKLIIGGTVVGSIDASGNLRVLADVLGESTP